MGRPMLQDGLQRSSGGRPVLSFFVFTFFMEILHSEDTSGEATHARSLEVVVATWQSSSLALKLRPKAATRAGALGAKTYCLCYERLVVS